MPDPVGPDRIRIRSAAVRDLAGGLRVGDRLSGTVESDAGGGRYVVRILGESVGVTSRLRLSVGEGIRVRVRELTGPLVLEILGPNRERLPAGEGVDRALREAGIPTDPSGREAVRTLLDAGRPPQTETIRALLDWLRPTGPEAPLPRPEVARALLAFDVPLASAAGRYAAAWEGNGIADVLLAAARALEIEGLGFPEGADLAARIRRLLAGPAARLDPSVLADLRESVVRLLDARLAADPVLREIDALVREVAEGARRGRPLVALPEGAAERIGGGLPREGSPQEMLRALQHRERQLLDARPWVDGLREGAGRIEEASVRMRLAGLLSTMTDRGEALYEALLPEGRFWIRVLRDGAGGGGGSEGKEPASVLLDLTLSELGRVGMLIREAGPGALAVAVRADPEALDRLRGGEADLRERLAGAGWAAADLSFRERNPAEAAFDPFAGLAVAPDRERLFEELA